MLFLRKNSVYFSSILYTEKWVEPAPEDGNQNRFIVLSYFMLSNKKPDRLYKNEPVMSFFMRHCAGAHDGIRTRASLLGKQALSQLSYVRSLFIDSRARDPPAREEFLALSVVP